MGSDPKRRGGYNDQYAKWQQGVSEMKAPTATGKPATAAQMKLPGGENKDVSGVPQLRPMFSTTNAGPGIPPPMVTPPPPRQGTDMRTMLANLALRASAPGHFGGTHPSQRTGSGRDRGDYSGSGGRGGNYR